MIERMQELISKLQRFQGATFVIKYGGSFMDSPEAAGRDGVARDVAFLAAAGIGSVLVHGGGKAITAALARTGVAAQFLQGLRVTDKAAAQVVERVLSQEINPGIVSSINSLGGRAKGFSGTEIFTCRKLRLAGADGERLEPGFVGEVVSVRTELLSACLRDGIIPVVSPTARGQDGQIYNCNADTAAAHTAIALRAQRLVFMSDVPGLLRDAKDPATLIPRLSAGEVDGLKKSGVIDKGMIPKVNSAVAALRAGVEKVFFVDGRVAHAILLELRKNDTAGTEIVLDDSRLQSEG